MQDELTAAGRERWQRLMDEAADARRACTVAPNRRRPIRAGLAATLVALAARLDPTLPVPAEAARSLGTTPA